MPNRYTFVDDVLSMYFRSAKGFKETLIASEDKFYQHCNAAFGSWDFALSDIKNVALKKKSIFNEIQVPNNFSFCHVGEKISGMHHRRN